MHNWWTEELGRLVWLLMAGGVFGYAFNFFWFGIAFAVLVYVICLLQQIEQLNKWLKNSEKEDIPVQFGLVFAICLNIKNLHKSYQARAQRSFAKIQEYKLAVMELPDAVVALGEKGEIRWSNRSAKNLFGLQAKTDKGRVFANFFRSPELKNYLAKGDFNQALTVNYSPIDNCILSIRAVRYGKGQLMLVVRDVSAEMAAQRSLNDFVANASHELLSPLTVVRGGLEHLHSVEQLPESLESAVVLMEGQALRMTELIEDLLVLAKLQGSTVSTDVGPVDMQTFCQSVIAERIALESQHKIELQLLSSAKLKIEEKQLHSLLTNLLENACKYTDENSQINVVWQEKNNALCLSVEDKGQGISSQHLTRLTERFYRVDDARTRGLGGTGLGLAIVKSILDRYQAELKIESEVGFGSTFCCMFPLSHKANE